ncbi:MAG TPA: type I methionyl aminopeptidase, partial [Lachnospiraceae bacterium]|nr:type I methionyl aminopeptidase [Lachnospiraceae bacterium]
MSITIKSEKEIEYMRESGRILSVVLEELQQFIRPGITTLDIDRKCRELIKDFNCIPSFLNYEGFPASICVSVNDEVVHGIPDQKHVLKGGDIVSLDGGVIYKGYHSDAARTVAVGEISKEAEQLIEVTKQSFYEGIKYAKQGYHLHEVSEAIQK